MTDRRSAQQAYAAEELENQVIEVAATGPGVRNRALNAAALRLGHYVGAGAISAEQVERRLTAAAVRAGLTASEARSTIRSGLAAGARDPAFARDRERFEAHRVQTAPPAAPVEPSYQQLVRSLIELCPMEGEVANYLRSRGLPSDVPDLIGLPPPPEQPALLAELTARHGRDAVLASGLADSSGLQFQWSGHRLGMIWRDAITGDVASVQRRLLGKPAEKVPKTVFAKGRRISWPWGAHLLRGVPKHEPVAIVEGVLDWLAWRALYPFPDAAPCIALSSAAPLRPEWVALLAGRVVFVALDSDAAGEAAAARIIEQLTPCAAPIRVRPWPGCKDWADSCAPAQESEAA